MPAGDIEIIDTHVHAQPPLTDTGAEVDSTWFRDLFSGCRHPTRLVVSCSESSRWLKDGRNVAMMRAIGDIHRTFPDVFIGALMVEPHATEDALAAVELGVRDFGLRLVGEQCQYIHNYRTDGPEMLPVIQKAVDLDVAVSFHVSSERHAEAVARLAEKFPRARFLAAHYSGGRSWRRGLEAVRRYANIWVEIQAVQPERIRGAIDAVGTRRLTIGTDFFLHERPDCRYRRGDSILDCLKTIGLKDADIERIASGNARELLRLED